MSAQLDVRLDGLVLLGSLLVGCSGDGSDQADDTETHDEHAWTYEDVNDPAGQVADFVALHPDSHRPRQPIGDRVLQHDTD